MGQQQLLLVILVTVIIAIASVTAMAIFRDSAEQANIDACRQDLAELAGQMQAYREKPIELGGGGGSFANVTFSALSFHNDSLNGTGLMAMNENGLYNIESVTDTEVVVTAQPARGQSMNFGSVANTELTQRAEIQQGTFTVRFQL